MASRSRQSRARRPATRRPAWRVLRGGRYPFGGVVAEGPGFDSAAGPALANGSLVLALETDFDGCMAIVQQLAAEPGIYLANSMNRCGSRGKRPSRSRSSSSSTGKCRIGCHSGGNLGNVSALGAGFLMLYDLV